VDGFSKGLKTPVDASPIFARNSVEASGGERVQPRGTTRIGPKQEKPGTNGGPGPSQKRGGPAMKAVLAGFYSGRSEKVTG